ncbi:MAG: phosphoribosylamine--glycine ligase [Pseudomonadota bacterium]
MNVLVIGGGGREHALCATFARSPACNTLYCAPGNAGIASVARCLTLDPADHAAVINACAAHTINLVVVGPEAPLVAGLADALRDAGIATFGPSQAAAMLEGSKAFTKAFCARHAIPTAASAAFHDRAAAHAYLEAQGAPIVIKADGLAAGKGVTMAHTAEEAMAAIDACFDAAVGGAGSAKPAPSPDETDAPPVVVIERWLHGEEVSFFALIDGTCVVPLGSAQDHKRAFDGDEGPNTGGMGAYAPAPIMDAAMTARVMETIIEPTARGMVDEGRPFSGVLFAGLMITAQGPQLIEYNVRFGDPECQVLLMRLRSDLLALVHATATGTLADVADDVAWHDEAALSVVMATRGYPGTYGKGSEIRALEAVEAKPDVEVFHAGTSRDDEGRLRAIGGRVLAVTARGTDVAEAQARAYAAVDDIDWPEGFCRRDIGWRALKRG